MNKDITFCMQNKDCPLRDKCERNKVIDDVAYYAKFFEENKECEYFIPCDK